jgi:hypothetical protein
VDVGVYGDADRSGADCGPSSAIASSGPRLVSDGVADNGEFWNPDSTEGDTTTSLADGVEQTDDASDDVEWAARIPSAECDGARAGIYGLDNLFRSVLDKMGATIGCHSRQKGLSSTFKISSWVRWHNHGGSDTRRLRRTDVSMIPSVKCEGLTTKRMQIR